MKWLIGIDEVGRGPLAGPVCVGLCGAPFSKKASVWKVIKGARDSKQLTHKERLFWFGEAKRLVPTGELFYYTSMVSQDFIDKFGISKAIKLALERSIKKAKLDPNDCRILLDGSLYAPEVFFDQETIIKGDDKEPIISMASIIAKVRRDAYMDKLALTFPQYGFEQNKGYGTKEHRKALEIHGPSPVHRMSFLTRILNVKGSID